MAKEEHKEEKKKSSRGVHLPHLNLSPKALAILADEVAKTVVSRLPYMPQRQKKKSKGKSQKQLERSLFLDTSAIIDIRIFDVIKLGLLSGNIVVLESILLELKHIADSQDAVKRERGRKGLESLEKIKRVRGIKLVTLNEDDAMKKDTTKEVDERLIKMAKQYKGRIITCDYNLEKKAAIQGVVAINMNALANVLKVQAVPGDALHIKILHPGKDATQGVGYLDDGTMIVTENASAEVGKMVNVVVARVIQTAAGKILFAKKI